MGLRYSGRASLRASRSGRRLARSLALPESGKAIEVSRSTLQVRRRWGRRDFGRFEQGERQALLMLEQREKRLLGLLLALQELAVQFRGLFGQPLERDQVLLG